MFTTKHFSFAGVIANYKSNKWIVSLQKQMP